MSWQELTFRCDFKKAVDLSDMLTAAGAESVSLSDASGEAVIESDAGATPLWPKTKVCGLFRVDTALDALIDSLGAAGYGAPDIAAVEDRDWEQAWWQNVVPRRFGQRLWVLPSFAEASPDHNLCVRLDPGLAFGTGAHPTTALCLEWLDATLRKAASVIDYGCGSGILAIAALRLGAASVRAVDTDTQALETARANAVNSACGQQISFHAPSSLPRDPADLLVANILANPLISLCDEIAGLVRAGGQIALSGILVTQANAVCDAFTKTFELRPVAAREDWVLVSGRRRDRVPE